MTTRIRLMVLVATLLAALGALVWWAARPAHRIDPDDPEQVALGRTVYSAHCASCHGTALEGQPDWQIRRPDGRLPAPPHDETGHTWHHPDEVLLGITRHGIAAYAPPGYESDMPGFADELSDDEIRAVLSYIKSTWPPEIRRRQAEIDELAGR